MSKSNRRAFLGQLGAAAAIIPGLRSLQVPSAAAQAPGGAPSYDLLITGGRVIDPSQNLSAERDVAISGGRIARIAANIPPNQARMVYDAKGKLVTPGLIDIHTHVYKYGINLNVDSDAVGFQSGVTTLVDAGSTGTGTFQGFRRYVMETAPTRIYALLNISSIGLVVTNEIYLDPRMLNAQQIIRTIGANRDRILGIKVRVNGRHSDLEHDLGVMKIAREAGDATGLPIMLHWTVEPDLLALLKRGDILSHPFNPPSPNSSNVFGADGPQADKVLPQILALKERGIWTDGQLATTHHAWDVSEKAAKLGLVPRRDFDRHQPRARRIAGERPGADDGVPPPRHAARAGDRGRHHDAGQIFNFPEKVGTLEPGVTADVAVLELQQGTFEYADQTRVPRTMKQQFVATATIKGGIFLKGAPPPPGGRGGAPGPGGRGATPTAPAGGRGGRN